MSSIKAPRPTEEELARLVDQFATNAYRLYALRNIDTAVVRITPDISHPFARVMMNPGYDAYPRALVVLAHATLEGVVRNIVLHLHPTMPKRHIRERFAVSSFNAVVDSLRQCGVAVDLGAIPWLQDALTQLIKRRHRIAHHADLPQTEESITSLRESTWLWAYSAVLYSALAIRSAFPELRDELNSELRHTVERVVIDWHDFIDKLRGQGRTLRRWAAGGAP